MSKPAQGVIYSYFDYLSRDISVLTLKANKIYLRGPSEGGTVPKSEDRLLDFYRLYTNIFCEERHEL